ncbi:helix-turn-helix domain-containing protein [Hyperthermus butylicus]|uniref:HTH bat-type domain-containing protein n=1 Tax=Hyperthermus butylicus (strain DSM 5456 / JCM 9403 / PLM1-5) TaxID=415426 RepID=A2BMX7_HYPBU|nr:helix-turn-helix domain-containing protein [Hyperthermus butylicus]ABM81338.1 hypothetical protein Hbut_1516 [Hyperthermus butylicus DSM 5456]
MSNVPLVVFCLRDNLECPLYMAVSSAAKKSSDTDSGPLRLVSGLAARVLRVNIDWERGVTELWVRASGGNGSMEEFERQLKRMDGLAFQRVYSSKFNNVYRILVDVSKCACLRNGKSCLLVSAPIGVMAKSVIIAPYGILCEFIVARGKGLDYLRSSGYRIVFMHRIDEYDYMLTEKQELALIYAYLMGYYSFPRRISLKSLAAKLGVSVSTLAELLRKAEAKVVEAFVRHELPHYLVGIILNREAHRRFIEEKLTSNKKACKDEETSVSEPGKAAAVVAAGGS